NKRRPTVSVVKALTPTSDAGRFDLKVGSTVVKSGAGDGDQGSITIARGADVTVSEVSASGPGLSAYDSSIDCGSGSVAGASRTLTNVTSDVTCTVTNKRRPTVTVVKSLVPAGDAGRFDLRVGSTVVKAGAGDGDRGSVDVGYGSDVTVSEVAATGTDAGEYDAAIDCGSGGLAGTSRSLTKVTADVTCTITNTRKSEPPPPPPPPPPPSVLALTSLNITPKTFAPGTSVVTFSLSRAAAVTYRVDRLLEGKERGGRCTVSGASRKSGKRCIRYDQIAKLTSAGVAGANRFSLDGKPFGAGRYRLRVIAQSGAESTPEASVRFRIT
ncbi:MAG: hypothetical protein QOJ34_3187, partial [Pseudonocardiales bacterium]|nr:hypothetical protein [Pseudonocardiales bacterium]